MSTKLWVVAMTLLALTYVFMLGGRAITLLADPNPIAVLFGAGMLLFPVVAIWALWQEISFGRNSQRVTEMALELNLPELDLELRPSGKATKESAAIAFEKLKADFDETKWTDWLLLAEAYEANGDRKRARHSMRKAISLADKPKPSKP